MSWTSAAVSHRLHRVPRGGKRHLYRGVTRSSRHPAEPRFRARPNRNLTPSRERSVQRSAPNDVRKRGKARKGGEWCGHVTRAVDRACLELRRHGPERHRFGGLNGRVLARSVPPVWTTANASRTRGAADILQNMIRRQPVSATADHAEERTNPAARLGFQPGAGGPGDRLRRRRRPGAPRGHRGSHRQDLVDEDYDDVADAVVLWFRDEDGDLTDALVDATT